MKNLTDQVIKQIEKQITNAIKGIELTRANYHKSLKDKEFTFENLIEDVDFNEIDGRILRIRKSIRQMHTEIEVLEKVLTLSGLEYDYVTNTVVEERPRRFEVTRGYVGTK